MSKKKIVGIILGGFFGLIAALFIAAIFIVSVVDYSQQSQAYNKWCANGFDQLFIYNGDTYQLEMMEEKCFTNFESWKGQANTGRASQYLGSYGATLDEMIVKSQEMESQVP